MSIVEFGHWTPQAGKQEALFQALGALAETLKKTIPDIALFVVLKGSSPDDEIWTVQSFKTQAAKDAYDGLNFVRDMNESSTSQNILAGPPRHRKLNEVTGYSCNRQFTGEPISVVASMTYKPMTRESSYALWRKVADFVQRKERGTLSYWFLEDAEAPDVLHAFERFTDSASREIHGQSSMVRDLVQKQTDIRVKTVRILQEHPSSILGTRSQS